MARPIDADALKDVIQQHDYLLADRLNSIDNGMFTIGIFQAIDQMPTLSPNEVRGVGEWIKLDAHKGMEQYKCSVCEASVYVPECMGEPMYNYCPSCGARMTRAEAEKAMEVRG